VGLLRRGTALCALSVFWGIYLGALLNVVGLCPNGRGSSLRTTSGTRGLIRGRAIK
jgi:hypothetical protein